MRRRPPRRKSKRFHLELGTVGSRDGVSRPFETALQGEHSDVFIWIGSRFKELQIPRLRSELVTFLIWLVVRGWKAWKSICQQASLGSFDSAP